jgi:hypothetical protein
MCGSKTLTLSKLGKTELVTIDPPIPEVLDSPPLGGLESGIAGLPAPFCAKLRLRESSSAMLNLVATSDLPAACGRSATLTDRCCCCR